MHAFAEEKLKKDLLARYDLKRVEVREGIRGGGLAGQALKTQATTLGLFVAPEQVATEVDAPPPFL
jgi:hypothetical protein